MIHIKSKKESSQRQGLGLTNGWEYYVECTVCGWELAIFSTLPNLDTLDTEQLAFCVGNLNGELHKCGEHNDNEPTAVMNMASVFDDQLMHTLPQTIIEQLETLPHLRRLGTTNLQRLQAIMDLMRHPNNMLQLWVWTRLSWAFGGCDAEKAEANFNALIYAIDSQLESERSTDDAVKGAAIIKLRELMRNVARQDHRFPQWPAYNAFMSGTSEDTWDNRKPNGDDDA